MRMRPVRVLLAAIVLGGCGGEDGAGEAPVLDDAGVAPFVPPPVPPARVPDGCVPLTVFPDDDGDGHGDATRPIRVCGRIPSGHVTVGNDCDDTRADVSPLSPERCNGIDDDCDGLVDEDLPEVTVFPDADGDGFGADEGREVTCGVLAEGWVRRGGDCDDAEPEVHPGAAELCNGIDDDCDGVVDEGVVGPIGPAVPLGDAAWSFRQVALASLDRGFVAAWTEPAERVAYAVLDPSGRALGGPWAADADAREPQAYPVLAATRTRGEASVVLGWVEAGTRVRVRSLGVDGGQPRPAETVADGPAAVRVPVELVGMGEDVILLWLERRSRDELHAVRVDAATALPLSDPALLHVSARIEPDNLGPSAAAIAGDPDALYLGLADRRPGDAVTVGYVERVRVRPSFEATGPRVRLGPLGGSARRVALAANGGSALLAFVSHGAAPDEETEVFRIGRTASGLSASRTAPPSDGLVVATTSSPGGVDVALSDVDPIGRRSLAIGICGDAGPHAPGGRIASLLSPWAAVARGRGTAGAMLYAGRVSDTAVSTRVWIRRYGCE